jgi:hypothetical protein
MIKTDFSIHFKPVTLSAFGGKQGHWANYPEIKKAGITSLTVTPILQARWISSDLVAVDLDMHFDEKAFPENKFGMVYGDGQFETSVESFMARVFPEDEFGSPGYTEQGMQGEAYVSMEYGSGFYEAFAGTSAHFRLELREEPLIEDMDLGQLG